jgi:N-acetylglucosamine kinase-like BadF-type ATPase
VFDAYRDGDEWAVRIVDDSARALAELLNSGVELYGAKPLAVASGGLFEHHSEVMLEHIAKYSDARIIMSGLPPVYGACRKACLMSADSLADSFYENFSKTYAETKK